MRSVGSLPDSACQDIIEARHAIVDVKSACTVSEYGCKPSIPVRIQLPDLRLRTLSVADIFWYCGGTQAFQVLPRSWHGLCTAVLLEGRLRLFMNLMTTIFMR